MNKRETIDQISKSITKTALISFFAVSLVSLLGVFWIYEVSQNKQIQIDKENVARAWANHENQISTQIGIIASTPIFLDYLRSGKVSRQKLEPDFIRTLRLMKTQSILGMSLSNRKNEVIYASGVTTPFFVRLDLPMINDGLSYKIGTGKYYWTLFFDKAMLIDQLKLAGANIDSSEKGPKYNLLQEKKFGIFDIAESTDIELNLPQRKSSGIFLGYGGGISLLLIVFALWNSLVVRAKVVGRLGEPLKAIAGRVKQHEELKNLEFDISELNYLVEELVNAQEALKLSKKKEKDQEVELLGAHLAHELRTPIASISSGAKGIGRFYPILLDGYRKALEANLPVHEIDILHFEKIKDLAERQTDVSRKAMLVIDMFLESVQSLRGEGTSTICDIENCINEAIDYYLGTSGFKGRLEIVKNDNFEFLGNKMLMIHIICNLLKNSMHVLANQDDASIEILIGGSPNQVLFRDNGPGVDESQTDRIFDRFFSTRKNGTGLGLSFCKMAMQSMKGNIECRSEKGQFTEFLLTFPNIK